MKNFVYVHTVFNDGENLYSIHRMVGHDFCIGLEEKFWCLYVWHKQLYGRSGNRIIPDLRSTTTTV